MSFWHVYPVDDLIKHDTENGADCECEPLVRVMPDSGDLMVIHNKLNEEPYSLDGTKLLQECSPQ